MSLSLSTCWNSWKHHDGRPMIEEILGLGFDTIEISHGIRASEFTLERENEPGKVSARLTLRG